MLCFRCFCCTCAVPLVGEDMHGEVFEFVLMMKFDILPFGPGVPGFPIPGVPGFPGGPGGPIRPSLPSRPSLPVNFENRKYKSRLVFGFKN